MLLIGYGCLLTLFGLVRKSFWPVGGKLSLILAITGGVLALACGAIALSRRSRHILIVSGMAIIGLALLGQPSGAEAPVDISVKELLISLVLGGAAGFFLGSGYDSTPFSPPKKLPRQNYFWK